MRVLIDYAHADLWESLIRLFSDRFGWEVFRPIGMEWYDSGIWSFERQRLGDQVARQFLQTYDKDKDKGDYSERPDTTHPGRTFRMVTHEQAHSQRWDLVIATLAENEPGLHRFAKDRQATYGIQIGNQGAPNNWALAQFAMSSTTLPHVKPWMPYVIYHQEFSLEDFRFEYPPTTDEVATRVQCFATMDQYNRFKRLAAMSGGTWRHYGHCGQHDEFYGGDAPTTPQVADQMRASRIGYHVKEWSDGYGHVIHNWFAVGRPVIGSAAYYRDKLAGPLFVEGETSFDLDLRSDAEVVELVKRLREDDDYHRLISENAAARFREHVNFDAEAMAIYAMLANVMSDRVAA
jgi:hypothetical protein